MGSAWLVLGLLSLLVSVGVVLVLLGFGGRVGRRAPVREVSPEALAWIECYHLEANPFDVPRSETAALVRQAWHLRSGERYGPTPAGLAPAALH